MNGVTGLNVAPSGTAMVLGLMLPFGATTGGSESGIA